MKTIERYVITALMRDMRAAGYQVAAVHDGEGYWMSTGWHKRAPATIAEPVTDARALEAINSVDDCTLHFTDQNSTQWGDHGVLIILGNGQDCLSNAHVYDNEPFNIIIEAIYDKLNEGALLDSSDTGMLAALRAVRDYMDDPTRECPLPVEVASAVRIAVVKGEQS